MLITWLHTLLRNNKQKVWLKQLCVITVLLLAGLTAHAQMEDLELAMQYSRNGEPQKAADIYQKLYKLSNESYFQFYFKSLIGIKKFDEAESITKKMMRKHPQDYQYNIALGNLYREKGLQDKADAVFNDIIKNMPAEQSTVSEIAMQFYQAENADLAIKTFVQGRKILHNNDLYSNELSSLYRYKHDKPNMVNEFISLLLRHPEFVGQMKNTLLNQFDGNDDYNMLKAALLKAIQANPQQLVLADMLTWQYLQQKQFDQALLQALALSRRQKDDGSSIFDLCQTLVSNAAYDEAIRGYEYIISKGKDNEFYVSAKIELLTAKNLKITSGKYEQADLLGLEKDYQNLLSEFGRNSSTAFAMQKLAQLQAFKLHKLNDAQKLLEDAITIPNIRPNTLANCKLDLGDVYLLNNKPWDATLMYSQIEKSFPATAIAQEAQYRNAKLAYYTGDFTWAKGQLDVLKAATSQLIANDALNLSLMISDHTAFDSTGNALKMYARADLLIFKQEPDKALITLDSIDKAYPGNNLINDILMAKARIHIQKKEYELAANNLKIIADDNKFDLWADDAVYMLGDIYENQLNDKAKAQAYYQRIITDYPGSSWLNDARKRFRTLRGDLPAGS
ncbi:lipopolysaccharide biosynthesis regulator YciM [Mucilaginibacter gracilis]|uniref:Lipopolysaccharide biosynthesis regulator YciM n=1 Tax=Mucilaginibacter gracilis TaxID=423350 RepID=A0A495IXM4_9SPHI|nr:tetratricopeptide repeat protein [Mucilaginibacter gracilis]RKR81440.1 lipopolysaccharide biosynthesis regulator YciM [Mucilaginibacter gracilis]